MCADAALYRLAGVLLALVVATSAAAMDPAIEVTVPDVAVSVGDRVPVRVQARGGEDWLWGDLTVQVSGSDQWAVGDGPRPVEGSSPPAWTVTLVPLALGNVELPKLAVSVRPPDGEPRAVTAGETIAVEVASVLPPGEDVAPAPLRDPLGVHGLPWEWLVPILIVLIPALAAQHWWLRRRSRQPAGVEGEDLPPLEQLANLTRELDSRIGQIPPELVCDRIAGGFRRYLERRTGEPALEMTSFELRVLARARRWPDGVQRSIQRVMGVADGVRFGRGKVPDSELRQALALALDGARELEDHLAPAADEESLEAAS